MYYLVNEGELPADIQAQYHERMPDGRVIIDHRTLKTCGTVGNITAVPTLAALEALRERQRAEIEAEATEGEA